MNTSRIPPRQGGGAAAWERKPYIRSAPKTPTSSPSATATPNRPSARSGRWRGGMGTETIYKIGSENTQLATFGEGDFEPAFGLFGGRGGILNLIKLTYPGGKEVIPRNKD